MVLLRPKLMHWLARWDRCSIRSHSLPQRPDRGTSNRVINPVPLRDFFCVSDWTVGSGVGFSGAFLPLSSRRHHFSGPSAVGDGRQPCLPFAARHPCTMTCLCLDGVSCLDLFRDTNEIRESLVLLRWQRLGDASGCACCQPGSLPYRRPCLPMGDHERLPWSLVVPCGGFASQQVPWLRRLLF